MTKIILDEDKIFQASGLLESIRKTTTENLFTASDFCNVIAKVCEAEALLDAAMKEGELMVKRKILTAFIEQVVEFDNESDYQQYLNSLKAGKSLYHIKDIKRDIGGKVCVTIRKQYNNNAFPDKNF